MGQEKRGDKSRKGGSTVSRGYIIINSAERMNKFILIMVVLVVFAAFYQSCLYHLKNTSKQEKSSNLRVVQCLGAKI